MIFDISVKFQKRVNRRVQLIFFEFNVFFNRL